MDLRDYVQAWRARWRLEDEALAGARARAREALPLVVEALRRRGARQIWLIGSLADGTFRPQSDLDVMVAGLDEQSAWQAAGEAADRTGFAVDVVRAESLPEPWRRHHERFGERLDV